MLDHFLNVDVEHDVFHKDNLPNRNLKIGRNRLQKLIKFVNLVFILLRLQEVLAYFLFQRISEACSIHHFVGLVIFILKRHFFDLQVVKQNSNVTYEEVLEYHAAKDVSN